MVHIRPIALEDAAEVSALVTQLGYQRSPEQVRQWTEASDAARQTAFVALRNAEGNAEEVVGWIEAERIHHLQSEPHVLIGGLVVKDGVRGLGVGRILCERVERWAVELGVDLVRVTSRSTRADAHRFYLRDGYHLTKTSLVFEKAIKEKRTSHAP